MKRELLLVFFLCGEVIFSPILYCQDKPVSVVRDQHDVPKLELDGDILITFEDEEVLAFLAQEPEEPSILWILFCTLSSKALAKLMRAKRYVGRLIVRMKTWLNAHIISGEQPK